MRIPFLYLDQLKTSLDPARVHNRPEFNLLRALYSPLFETDNHGQIQPGLADSFEWEGNNLKVFLKKIKSSKGDVLDADDVLISLKRIIKLNSNTHGKLQNFLCQSSKEKACEGITGNKNVVTFQLKPGNQKHFFISLLSSMDFVIIPKRAFALDKEGIPIVDFTNTSGAYFMSKKSEEGITLIKNPNSYHSLEKSPSKIILTDIKESLTEAFSNDKVDLISTVTELSYDEITKIRASKLDVNIHKSGGIRQLMLVFMKKGVDELSEEERIIISNRVRNFVIKSSIHRDMAFSSQLIPQGGNGGLNEDQEKELKSFLSIKDSKVSDIEIQISEINYKRWLKKGFNLKDITLNSMTKFPVNLPKTEQPHAILVYGDSSFFEDISFLSYGISMGAFSKDREEGHEWLNQYMEIADKKERMQELSTFHLQALKNAIIFPIGFLPYYAVAKKPWKPNFSKFYAGSPFWMIHRH